MADIPGNSPASHRQDPVSPVGVGWLLPFVVALFFAWGFATVLIDTLVPKLKGLFALNYAEAMLSQFAFFLAYFFVSIPAGILLARIGYLRGIFIGLVVMAAGCILFLPAALAGVYWGFLLALFVMAAGITTLQVAANPLVAILGKPSASHFRLLLAQSFNSLGTFLGPLLGAAIILRSGVTTPDPATTPPDVMAAFRAAEVHAVQLPFLGIALGILALACVFWVFRKHPSVPTPAPSKANLGSLRLLARPRQGFGVLAIFLYVGAEVAIGSLMVNYLIRPGALGISAEAAGQLLALYWGGAMVGRLVGSLLLFIRIPAARLLTACALGAIGLVLLAALVSGEIGSYALIAVGLFNSIMFPTIFTLTIQGMGEKTPQVSGLLCMAIVGGAIIPLMTGAVADRIGLDLALIVPAVCYLLIASYGQFARASERQVLLEEETAEGVYSSP